MCNPISYWFSNCSREPQSLRLRCKGDMVAVFSYMNVCQLAEEFRLLELGPMIKICRKTY